LLTIHDLIPLCFDDGHSEKEKRHFLKRLNNGIRNAKRIITVSAHTRKDLLAVFPDLLRPIDVIHWGSDRISEHAGKYAVDSPYLIAFGGEAKRKNTEYTLERYFAAAASLPDLKLIMVGINSKKLRENVIQLAEQRGLRERVILPGFVSESELDSLIRNATAMLYLSLYEGFGLPLLEAIERGVPVIASDRTSIPEVLEGRIGCFPLENPKTIEQAIIDLLTHPDERKRWQIEQAKVLARFDWKKTATQTIRALESCV
jgi:glycosyltransferase involved in cell wall biosynthesis